MKSKFYANIEGLLNAQEREMFLNSFEGYYKDGGQVRIVTEGVDDSPNKTVTTARTANLRNAVRLGLDVLILGAFILWYFSDPISEFSLLFWLGIFIFMQVMEIRYRLDGYGS